MIKPPSIMRFEQYWWASTILWLIGTALTWSRTQAMLAATPQTAPGAPWVQWVSIAIVLLYTAAMWFLVARVASVVAK